MAAANALRNSLRSPIWVNETMVFVTDVPMLAPIIIGMATRTVRTAKIKPNEDCDDESVSVNGMAERESELIILTIGRHHTDNNGRRSGRTLYQDGGQYANHDSDDGILQQIALLENFSCKVVK